MKLKHLLLSAALAGTATMSAAPFDWDPQITTPSPYQPTVTEMWQVKEVDFSVSDAPAGLEFTETMAKWVDENGKEIVATEAAEWWGSYYCLFDESDFEGNGDYTLVFPAGMMKDAEGNLSAEKVFYFTFDIPALQKGMHSDFKVVDVFPDFNEPQGIWRDQHIMIDTNYNKEIGYTSLVVTDLDPEYGYMFETTNFNMNRQMGDEQAIEWDMVGTYSYLAGHEYEAVFTFYNGTAAKTDGMDTPVVDRVKYRFSGTQKAFEYSDVRLIDVDPEPATEGMPGTGFVISEPDQAVFTYTFSAPVTVYQAEIPMGPNGASTLGDITSNEDKTVWTVNASDNSVLLTSNTSVIVNIYAKDEEGRQLRGNMGFENNACYQFSWTCEVDAFELIVTPEAGAELDALTSVTVKPANGRAMNWCDDNTRLPFVQTKTRDLIGTLVMPDPSSGVTEITFTEWINAATGEKEAINLTEPGAYAVVFPHTAFLQGSDQMADYSRSQANGFTIAGGGTVVDPIDQETLVPDYTNPEEGQIVASVKDFVLHFDAEVTIDWTNTNAVAYLMDEDYEQVAEAELNFDYENEDLGLVYAFFSEAITAPGFYTLYVPARQITDMTFADTMGEQGTCNPDLFINFIIQEPRQDTLLPINVTPSNYSVLEAYVESYISFAEPVYVLNGKGQILDQHGNEIAELNIEGDYEDLYDDFGGTINVFPREDITVPGTYYVVIPAKSIGNQACYDTNGAEGIYNPELIYEYVVKNGSAVPETLKMEYTDPEEGIVEKLESVVVGFNAEVELEDQMNSKAYLKNEEGTTVAEAAISLNWNDPEFSSIKATFEEPVTAAGVYTLTIPAGTVCDYETWSIFNEEIILHYSIVETGVEAVNAAVVSTVCDMQGRVVMRNATAEQISKLAKGIYVIDGKKKTVK